MVAGHVLGEVELLMKTGFLCFCYFRFRVGFCLCSLVDLSGGLRGGVCGSGTICENYLGLSLGLVGIHGPGRPGLLWARASPARDKHWSPGIV